MPMFVFESPHCIIFPFLPTVRTDASRETMREGIHSNYLGAVAAADVAVAPAAALVVDEVTAAGDPKVVVVVAVLVDAFAAAVFERCVCCALATLRILTLDFSTRDSLYSLSSLFSSSLAVLRRTTNN